MKTNSKSNPFINFGYAILQFVIAVAGASLVAWLLDSYFKTTNTVGFESNTQQNETIVLATWVILFVLLLFLANQLTKRIRANG